MGWANGRREYGQEYAWIAELKSGLVVVCGVCG